MKTKSYLIDNKELMSEWDYGKNVDLDPGKLTCGSSKKVWWKCSKCKGSWQTTIVYRAGKESTGCPYCSGNKLLSGYNDLATRYPTLAEEWHADKNGDIKPSEVMPGTHKKYWWKCSKCGHEWVASPNNRTTHHSICPQCSINTYAIKGVNDLATTHTELTKEWSEERNESLTPQNVRYGSSKRVWWLCPNCGYEYKMSVYSRVLGSGCKHCIHTNQTSYPEQALLHYVQKIYPDAISRHKAEFLGRMELDIFIPSINYAIEYDGARWHKENFIKNERRKYELCHKNNIQLIRVREKMAPLGSDIADYQFSVVTKDGNPSLETTIKEVIRFINFSLKNIDINLNQDELKIKEKYLCKPKDSLANKYPDIAKQWHPDKNGKLTPDMFKSGSETKVWWKCVKCGYEWLSDIKHCTRNKKATCPACSNQVLIPGRNDLATTNPELAQEWHPTKNGDITPKNIITGFGKKYWWKCSKCEHEWQATIVHRKFSHSGCPNCYRNKKQKSDKQLKLKL